MIIEEHNVLELLEQGILAQVRSTCLEQEKVEEIQQRLLHSMLGRYKLHGIDSDDEQSGSSSARDDLEEGSSGAKETTVRQKRTVVRNRFRKLIMRTESSLTEHELQRKCVLKLYSMMKEGGMNSALAKQLSFSEFRLLVDESKESGCCFKKAFREKLQRLVAMGPQQHSLLEATSGKYDRLEEETSTTRHSDHHGAEEEEVRAT